MAWEAVTPLTDDPENAAWWAPPALKVGDRVRVRLSGECPVKPVRDSWADNMRDMAAKGRAAKREQHARGERVTRSKLTEAQVREIRDAYVIGEPRHRIAREFGVAVRTVWWIGSGRGWAHVV